MSNSIRKIWRHVLTKKVHKKYLLSSFMKGNKYGKAYFLFLKSLSQNVSYGFVFIYISFKRIKRYIYKGTLSSEFLRNNYHEIW